MGRLIGWRIVQGVATLFAISLILFILTLNLQGNAADAVLGQAATAETKAAFERSIGLDVPAWQRYLRDRQPPILVTWGRNDPFFTLKAVEFYREQVPGTEVHLFDAGHFALETHAPEIARHIRDFMARLPPLE